MKVLVVVVLVLASSAHAETPEGLTQSARNIARDGRCEALPAIGDRVRALDPEYYARVWRIDPVIAGCTQGESMQVGGPPSLTPIRVAAPTAVGAPKSADVALGLSLGVTAAGLGLIVAGANWNEPTIATTGTIVFLVGPTTGHIYGGHTLNGGLGARAIGAVTALAGFSVLLSCFATCDNQDGKVDVAGALLIGGGLVYAGGGIYEIATAPEAAHRYNRQHGFEATVVPTGNGIALAGRF